jgi:hypothetical protein
MAFETRPSASEHHGVHDGDISSTDFKSFLKVGQRVSEEAIDEGEEEEQEADRLASMWLQQHKPDDSYRAVRITVLADVQGMLFLCLDHPRVRWCFLLQCSSHNFGLPEPVSATERILLSSTLQASQEPS